MSTVSTELTQKTNKYREARNAYLKRADAAPISIEAMALWVAVWEAQGGTPVKTWDYDYYTPTVTATAGFFSGASMNISVARQMGLEDGDFIVDGAPAHENASWNYWAPRDKNIQVPAGYGATALNLLFVADEDEELRIPPATGDHREGWEWGHTKVYTLVRKDGILVADSNTHRLFFHRDVVELARTMGPAALTA